MSKKQKKSSTESSADAQPDTGILGDSDELMLDEPEESENARDGFENPDPKDSTETHVELPQDVRDLSEHISKAGNKVYEEGEAKADVGKIHKSGTTAAFIEVVVPRQPGLEAALRASATAAGVADGSIKPEDVPGAQIPEGGVNLSDGGDPENGNSRTSATKPSDSPDVNPNSPIQVGHTKETAKAASDAMIENGEATADKAEDQQPMSGIASDAPAGDYKPSDDATAARGEF